MIYLKLLECNSHLLIWFLWVNQDTEGDGGKKNAPERPLSQQSTRVIINISSDTPFKSPSTHTIDVVDLHFRMFVMLRVACANYTHPCSHLQSHRHTHTKMHTLCMALQVAEMAIDFWVCIRKMM